MRWIIFLIPFLLALTPVHDKYDSEEKIREEFKNVYEEAQSREFEVVNDTPTLRELPEGRVVIFSSNTVRKILFRVDQDIFAVTGSCITVRR